MGTSRASRPIPLALTMLVALFSALVALAVAGGHDAAAHGNGDQHATNASAVAADGPIVTPRTVAFHDEMRRLRRGRAPSRSSACADLEHIADARAAFSR